MFKQKTFPSSFAIGQPNELYKDSKNVNVKKKVLSGNKLSGRSFFILPSRNIFRRILFFLLFNKFSEFLRYGLTIFNTLCFMFFSDVFNYRFMNLGFLLLLTGDIILQMICLGFFFGRYTYLRSSIWNAFDVFVLFVSWTMIYFISFTPFRIFIVFKLLGHVPFLSSLQAILHSFWGVIPRLRGVIILLFFLYLIFTLTGVDYFKNDVGRRCLFFENQTNNTFTNLNQLKKNDIDYFETIPTMWCSRNKWGFQCPGQTKCIDKNRNLYSNIGSFDTWYNSALVSFQLISLSGWSQYFYATAAVETFIIPLFWMLFLIFSFTFVVVNVIISAIENAFAIRKEKKIYEKNLEIHQYYLFSRLLEEIPNAFISKIVYHLGIRFPFINIFKVSSNFLAKFVNSFIFDSIIIAIVISNIFVELIVTNENTVTLVSEIFIFVYLGEVILKIMCLGARYFSSFFNLSDFFLVLISLILYILTKILDFKMPIHQYLYVIKMLRIISLLNRFPLTKIFMNKVSKSVIPALSIIFFIVSTLFLFGIVGNMIFYQLIQKDKNYNTVIDSVISLFVILTGDNWEDNLYEILSLDPDLPYLKQKKIKKEKVYFAISLSIPFFILFYIVTNFFLVNFFTAVVLQSFYSEEDFEWLKIKNSISSYWKKLKKKIFKEKNIEEENKRNVESNEKDEKDEKIKFNLDFKEIYKNIQKFKKSNIYINLMLFLSIIAALVLIFDTPSSNDKNVVFKISIPFLIIDLLLWVIFTIDLFFGIFVDGYKYFLTISNYFDILFFMELTVTLTFSFIYNFTLPTAVAYVRLFIRSFRPFKIIVRFKDLKIYLNSIKNMILAFIQLSLLLVIVFTIYGILGAGMFGKKFYSCNDETRFDIKKFKPKENLKFVEKQCKGYFTNGMDIFSTRVFQSATSNFDSISNSIISLIEISTVDKWSDFMYTITNQRGDEYQYLYPLYFMSFIIIVVLFIITLSIGIILDGIMEERHVYSYSKKQQYWSSIKRYIYVLNPIPKIQPIIKPIGYFVRHWSFTILILIVVIFDYIILSIQFSNQPSVYEIVINWLSFTCLLLFILEDIIKFFGLGIIYWLSDIWNIIDVIMVLGSIVILFCIVFLNLVFKMGIEYRLLLKWITRLMLYLRMLSLISTINSVKKIFRTLKIALPSIVNAIIMLVCLMYIYIVVGRFTFGNVRFGNDYNMHANFRNWDKSIILLLKVLTFDNWRNIMHDLSIQPPLCTATDLYNDCGRKIYAYIFFFSFIIIVSTLVLNLVIGIVLDNFNNVFFKSKLNISRRDIDSIREIWANYDKTAKGFIKMVDLRQLIIDLYDNNNKLSFNPGTQKGNILFWTMYYELQEGIKYDPSEREEFKYLVRFNIFLWLYNVVEKLKKIYRKIKKFCKIFQKKKQLTVVQSFKTTDKQNFTFNDFILSMCRFRVTDDFKTKEEIHLRRKFFESALFEIENKSFTRIKTKEWQLIKYQGEQVEWNIMKKKKEDTFIL